MVQNIRIVGVWGDKMTSIVVVVLGDIIEASASSSAPHRITGRVAREMRCAITHVGLMGRVSKVGLTPGVGRAWH